MEPSPGSMKAPPRRGKRDRPGATVAFQALATRLFAVDREEFQEALKKDETSAAQNVVGDAISRALDVEA